MTILSGDIKFLASKVMTDDPEGGGGPVGIVIPDGGSNAMFQDITEFDRAGGAVSIRQAFLAVQTPDREVFMDANLIVSMPPNDANVSITLAKCTMFARRTDIANSIENYLIQGPEWGGYLLENHVIGQRSVQLLQRPGTPTPPINRTLVLIFDGGLVTERKQYIRVTRVEVETRIFSYSNGSGVTDFPADVVTCDLTDALRYNFPGSAPSRLFAGEPDKTVVRDTTVADAATYYGASPLSAVANLGDTSVQISSIYTQLVPSARTETVALDQRPAAQRQITLATSPREITLAAAPHTLRDKVGQENRSFSWTQILRPFPAPNTVVVSFMALGVWYTVTDDGLGNLTGSGVGTVNYTNGSIAVTFPSLPDVGSSVIYSWGEKSAFTNRSGQAGFRAPEYALKLPHDSLKPGTLVVEWLSGAVLRTASGSATGVISGDGTGEVNYASGEVFIRPSFMLDAGGELQFDYDYGTLVTKAVTVTPDAGGFATIVLDTVPAAGSVSVQWITVRNNSASSGGSSGGSAASKNSGSTTAPVYYPGNPQTPVLPGDTGGGGGGGGGSPTVSPPPVAPVNLTRVPLNGNNYAPYMVQAGIRTSTSKPVFIGVLPEFTGDAGYYPVPDTTGVTWSEPEYAAKSKVIGGVSYESWGANQQAVVAEGG